MHGWCTSFRRSCDIDCADGLHLHPKERIHCGVLFPGTQACAHVCCHVLLQGLTVFRMWRDEEFIRDMLHFVSRVYTEHVLPDWPPPVNIFWGLPEYEQFLDRTNALANGATIVTQVPAAAVQRSSGSDQRAFL